ncbi:hypothetical protein, partial [Lactobacillus amylovorus]|uniref:hypothetical protein n=1 Tax=Lactobacillus amylovorus TaxID=1604 RepID=UPI003F91F9D5
LVEPLGLIPVDPDELVGGSGHTPMLRMQSVMFLGGQHAEVARIVVGSIPIDVVNLLAVFRSGDDTMLVCLDVLAGKTPAEPDVPLTVDEPTGLSRRWFFAVPKCAYWLGLGTKPFLPAGITPPPLVSSSRDDL